jgi:N-methylhydantoinase A
VDISSIGAGGGSVAWIDAGGLLKVGPKSVGSDPGPACYGRGGQAALTDAFLACGYLSAGRFAGGRVPLFPERAAAALRPLAERLGLEVPRAADRIVQVAVANMFAELSNVMERRGFDPREFNLVAYGGAGPLTASLLADEIGARGILVPLSPGTLCSLGALTADLVYDAVRAWRAGLDPTPAADWRRGFADLAEEARRWLATQHVPGLPDVGLRYSMDLRYSGQAFEIELPVNPAWIEALDAEAVREAFHRQHLRQYAHCDREADVEVVNLRIRLVGSTPKPPAVEMAEAAGPAPFRGERAIHYRGSAHEAGVYARSDLRPGHRVAGPAIVEQDDTTVLVLAGWRADVDRWGNLHLYRASA